MMWPKLDRASLVWLTVGAAATLVGIGVWAWASPSPHGIIELLIALPVIAAGVAVMGLALLASWRQSAWPLRVAGILLASAPVWVLLWFVLPR